MLQLCHLYALKNALYADGQDKLAASLTSDDSVLWKEIAKEQWEQGSYRLKKNEWGYKYQLPMNVMQPLVESLGYQLHRVSYKHLSIPNTCVLVHLKFKAYNTKQVHVVAAYNG